MNKDELKEQIALLADALLQLTEENLNLRKRLKNAERDARTDTLTGLGNKRYAIEEMARIKSLADRNQIAPSLICIVSIDMDNLKLINDTRGHSAGNTALCILAETLKSVTRTNDVVARIGGDEFLIIALFKSEGEILSFRSRLEKSFDNLKIKEKISASIGSFCSKLDKNFNFEKALEISDTKMYEAKRRKKADR